MCLEKHPGAFFMNTDNTLLEGYQNPLGMKVDVSPSSETQSCEQIWASLDPTSLTLSLVLLLVGNLVILHNHKYLLRWGSSNNGSI